MVTTNILNIKMDRLPFQAQYSWSHLVQLYGALCLMSYKYNGVRPFCNKTSTLCNATYVAFYNLLSANKVLIEFPRTLLIIIKWISSHKQLCVNDNFIINIKLTKITQKFNSMRCIKNIQDGIFLEIY